MRVVHIRFAEYNDKFQTSNAISAPRLVSIIAWFCSCITFCSLGLTIMDNLRLAFLERFKPQIISQRQSALIIAALFFSISVYRIVFSQICKLIQTHTKTICTDPTNMLNYKQHEQSRKNQVGCARRVRWPYD